MDLLTYWEIQGKDCTITLEQRLPYCDRGNFYAKVFPRGKLALDMDGQDGWPRYYFIFTNAVMECELWMKKRKQWTELSQWKRVKVCEDDPVAEENLKKVITFMETLGD